MVVHVGRWWGRRYSSNAWTIGKHGMGIKVSLPIHMDGGSDIEQRGWGTRIARRAVVYVRDNTTRDGEHLA